MGHRLLTVRQRRVLAALTKRTSIARFEANAITVRSLENRGLVEPGPEGWDIRITERGREVYAEDRRQEGHED